MAFFGGIKLKWFRRRLVFNDPQHSNDSTADGDDDDSDYDGPRSRREYRAQASAEPQLVRAVFRTGRENDDWVDDGWSKQTHNNGGTGAEPARQLPPIRVRAPQRAHASGNGTLLYARPQSTLFVGDSLAPHVDGAKQHDDDRKTVRSTTVESVEETVARRSLEDENPSIFSRPQSLQSGAKGLEIEDNSSPTRTETRFFTLETDDVNGKTETTRDLQHSTAAYVDPIENPKLANVKNPNSYMKMNSIGVTASEPLHFSQEEIASYVELVDQPIEDKLKPNQESDDATKTLLKTAEMSTLETITSETLDSISKLNQVIAEDDDTFKIDQPVLQPESAAFLNGEQHLILPPFAVGSVEIDVSPAHKEPLIFESSENLTIDVPQPPTRPVPPPRRLSSMNRKSRPTSPQLQLISSNEPPPYTDPDISTKTTKTTAGLQLSASAPDLQAAHGDRDAATELSDTPLPYHPPVSRTRSIFSFFTNGKSMQSISVLETSKPPKKKMKTVRVLKTAKSNAPTVPAAVAKAPVALPRKLSAPTALPVEATLEDPILQLPLSNGNNAVVQSEIEAATSFIEPEAKNEIQSNDDQLDSFSTDVTDHVAAQPIPLIPVGPPIIHLNIDGDASPKVRSPHAHKTVRFVTPDASPAASDNETTADDNRPHPMRRTLLTLETTQAATTTAGSVDPWDMVAQHRRATEALQRNRQLAAGRVSSSPTRGAEPKVLELSTTKSPADESVQLTLEPRPRTLREMQREQRERRERRQQQTDATDASDTEA